MVTYAGAEIDSVLVRCAACDVPEYQPLDESTEYTILTTQTLYDGAEGYDIVASEASSFEQYGK